MKLETKTLLILCGEAFSGKSTLSRKLADYYGLNIVGRDEVYFATEKILALGNTPDSDDGTFWQNLWPIVTQGIKNQLLLGNSVVVDDNCLYFKERESLRAIAMETNAKCILIYLDVPREIIWERKAENKLTRKRHDVPSGWLEEDTQLFERPTDKEKFIVFSVDTAFDDLIKSIDSYIQSSN